MLTQSFACTGRSTHMKGGRVVEGQGQGGHHTAEDQDQGDDAQHGKALQLEGVALVEAFQFIVLEAQRIERAAARRLDGMIHAAAVAAAGERLLSNGLPSSRATMERKQEGGN